MKVGDRVVCINDKPTKNWRGITPLKEGNIYIIKTIQTCHCGQVTLDVGIGNSPGSQCFCGKPTYHDKWWFAIERFREIDYNFGEQVAEVIEMKIMKEETILKPSLV